MEEEDLRPELPGHSAARRWPRDDLCRPTRSPPVP